MAAYAGSTHEALGREQSLVDQFLTQGDTGRIVHGKNVNRCSSDGCFADEYRSMPAEVFRPPMPSWIKQASQTLCSGIDAGEVWPFMEVQRRQA
jgi:hypothetical protein